MVSHWKTGLLIRGPSDNGTTVGGNAPNYVAVSGDSLFVSNGNNDLIERIGLSTGKLLVKQRIVPSPLVSRLRGGAIPRHRWSPGPSRPSVIGG